MPAIKARPAAGNPRRPDGDAGPLDLIWYDCEPGTPARVRSGESADSHSGVAVGIPERGT